MIDLTNSRENYANYDGNFPQSGEVKTGDNFFQEIYLGNDVKKKTRKFSISAIAFITIRIIYSLFCFSYTSTNIANTGYCSNWPMTVEFDRLFQSIFVIGIGCILRKLHRIQMGMK